jgi:glycosyltransferase involved in cell wall biosynthesis
MKLLIVMNGLGTGGAQRSHAETLPFLMDAGFDPILAVFYRPKEGIESQLLEQGYDVRHLDARTPMGRLSALRRLIRAERPALIHTMIAEANLFGRAAAAGTGIPVLSSLVSVTYDPARLADPNVNRITLELFRRLDAWTARNWTTHFHAISETVRASGVETLGIPPERITVVERGRDAQRLGHRDESRRTAVRRRMGVDPQAEVVLQVGRQEFAKGQRFLVEAFDELAPERPGLILWIAGRKGHASAELERLHSQFRFADRIEFLGHREDVPDLLAAADVFVFPSLYEGQGGALIEAMGMGLPVVVSDIPVLREAVTGGWNGLLAPPGSRSGLAAAIARLLDDRDLALRFGARNEEIFRRRYSIERSAQRMIALYHRVAAEGAG